jgi:hypothetical protein
MLKKIGFWLLVLVFAGAAVYSYFYLAAAKKPKTMATQAIPADCVFIIESSDYFKLWKKLNETNLIWQELQQVDYFQQVRETGKIIDSVLFGEEKTRSIFTGNPVYLAGIEIENHLEYLYALNVSLDKTESVVDFVKKISTDLQEKETQEAKEKYFQFRLKTGKGLLYVYLKSGLVLVAHNPKVLEKAIACVDKDCVGNDRRFRKMADMAGTAVDFRFYANLAHSGSMYLKFLHRNSLFESLSARQNKGWSEMDVDFKPNEMKLNGFTLPDSLSFLNYLSQQAPQELNFLNAAPRSTTNFLFIGLENFRDLYEKMEKNVLSDVDRNEHKLIIDGLSQKAGMDLRGKILNAIGNEIAALHTQYSDSIQDNFCMIHLNDRAGEEENFHLIADSIIHKTVKFNEDEHSDSVYYFKSGKMIPALTCGVISRSFHYCFFYSNYLIFCESPSAWERYVQEISKGKVLAENEDYVRFSEGNISDECNFFVYSFFPSSRQFISEFFNEEMRGEIEKHAELFNRFHSFGYQLSSYKGFLLNQAYLLYSPIYNRHNNTVWEVKLDTTAAMPPAIVINHKTGLEEIFTQDLNNTIYLISNTGKILWKKQLEERIKSEIFQVDYFQNNKLQIIFNTKKSLHMVDRNGNYVAGYPVVLPVEASNGINVFDYEKNRDYRIVFSGTDNKIYVYKGNGKPVEGFAFEGAADSISVPVQWEKINFRDYLLAFDNSGAVYGMGRKGEKRLSINAPVPVKNFSYKIEYGKDIDKTRLCFFDGAEKKIIHLYLDGRNEAVSIATELEEPAAFFSKINDDDYYDLVLVKDKAIEMYDDQGILLQRVKTSSKLKPLFKQLRKNSELYYSFIDEANNLLIFSPNWQEPEPTVKCSHLPAIEMLNDDGYYYMIGIHNDLVSCYSF